MVIGKNNKNEEKQESVQNKYIIPIIIGVIIGGILIYFGAFFERSSDLDVLITVTGGKPDVDKLGVKHLLVLKPWIEDSISVYLTADGGTPIYIENIEFFMHPGYWATPIEPQQIKIEYGETKEITLRFKFDEACWSNSNIAKDPDAYLAYIGVDIKIHYRNKNEVYDKKMTETFPLNLDGWEPKDLPMPNFC